MKEWTDEKILSEYERFQKLRLHSTTLTEDERHTFVEIVREMYRRRIGHYKDFDGPRTTGLDDKPYRSGRA